MDPAAVVGRIVYAEAGENIAQLNVTVEMLADPGSDDLMELVGQCEATWRGFLVSDAAAGQLWFDSAGVSLVRLDTVFFIDE